MARLAAVRSLSFAGSVPIVLDDALAELPEALVTSLLNKLERMSTSVQIIYLTDDPIVADWAGSIGIHRVAVVTAPVQLV